MEQLCIIGSYYCFIPWGWSGTDGANNGASTACLFSFPFPTTFKTLLEQINYTM